MRLFLKILVIFWSIFLSAITWLTFAQQQPDAFLLEIEPSTFDLNTPVDITIKAIKANWEVVKDYEWDVFIDVNGSLDTTDYTVPSEGLYTFIAQDQWVKTFSKWLIIKRAGTFTISASDITDDTIKWEKTVLVWVTTDTTDVKKIEFTSPLKGSSITNEILEVIWSVSELPNSPLEIYLNEQLVFEGTSDDKWNFTAYLSGVERWENTLSAKVLDVNGIVLWESDSISFTYDSAADGTFNSLQVLPWNIIKAGTKAIFKVSTSDNVTSATIKLSNGRSAPMDLESAGSFSKEIMIDSEGKLDISLELLVSWQKKVYTNISSIIVEKWTNIGKVRIFWDSVYKNKVNLTWDVEWSDAARYTVLFGTTAEDLSQSETVNKKELVLENLEIGQKYYFKVIPLDEDGQELWWASDIVNYTVGDAGETSCTVQWIFINDVQIGNNHYLVRSWVSNVEKYVIYRSDWYTTDVTQMQKVGETTDTKFEYPFNSQAKKDKYSYYLIQAICKDGKAVVMNDIKKVKTWPVENALLFVFLTLLFYSSYRLYIYNRS